MNKVYIIGIIIAIIIIVGVVSLYENVPEESIEVIVNETLDSEPKHFSEILGESAKMKDP